MDDDGHIYTPHSTLHRCLHCHSPNRESRLSSVQLWALTLTQPMIREPWLLMEISLHLRSKIKRATIICWCLWWCPLCILQWQCTIPLLVRIRNLKIQLCFNSSCRTLWTVPILSSKIVKIWSWTLDMSTDRWCDHKIILWWINTDRAEGCVACFHGVTVYHSIMLGLHNTSPVSTGGQSSVTLPTLLQLPWSWSVGHGHHQCHQQQYHHPVPSCRHL